MSIKFSYAGGDFFALHEDTDVNEIVGRIDDVLTGRTGPSSWLELRSHDGSTVRLHIHAGIAVAIVDETARDAALGLQIYSF